MKQKTAKKCEKQKDRWKEGKNFHNAVCWKTVDLLKDEIEFYLSITSGCHALVQLGDSLSLEIFPCAGDWCDSTQSQQRCWQRMIPCWANLSANYSLILCHNRRNVIEKHFTAVSRGKAEKHLNINYKDKLLWTPLLLDLSVPVWSCQCLNSSNFWINFEWKIYFSSQQKFWNVFITRTSLGVNNLIDLIG